MNKLLEQLNYLSFNYPSLRTVFLSITLLVIFYIIKKILHAKVAKRPGTKAEKILLKKKVTRYTFSMLLLSLLLLWFAQLQVVMVSILAVAAAIVLALKELIMCLTGGTLIRVSNVFKVGHRIEIDGSRGFVVEKSLLTTKVLEIGPDKYSQQTTGDIITFPNSLMLSKNLRNESYFKGYSLKSFVFKVTEISKINEFEMGLLETAKKFCDAYVLDAKKSISHFCEKEGILIPSVDPKTKLIVENGKDFSILVKLPVLNTNIADVEQELNRYYLRWRLENEDFEREE